MNRISLKPKKQDFSTLEEIKVLRTNLQFCGKDKKVILVTSCIAGEGKSTVALNLSVSLAELQKKVLLIDADLRKSRLYRQAEGEMPARGLSHYLSGQAELTDVICTVDNPQFHMIFAGPVPPNPSELLSAKRFRALIEKARNVYDYIVIDCAPLGLVIDAAIVASMSDAGILVIQPGKVSYRLARNVKEEMEKSGCPLEGVVLNGVAKGRERYGYANRYRKAYGEYYKQSEYETK